MAEKNLELRCPGCGRRVRWTERQGRDRIVCPRCRMVFETKPQDQRAMSLPSRPG